MAGEILRTPREPYLRVAVDGVDASGKTFFANELTSELTSRGADVVHASVDGFHNPRKKRYEQGRGSPQGFFEDSFNYETLSRLLLKPFGKAGDGRFVRSVYDVAADDEPTEVKAELAAPGTILVVDGIFLHRPELASFWDYSVFLEVQFGVSIPRLAARDSMSPDPEAESNRRYVDGQRIYIDRCSPARCATAVINNNDLNRPKILKSLG
ncbi:MAG: uridine kinase [bacterium]|nr:uridine kinase [bacterium]